jgi:hypothetical protein
LRVFIAQQKLASLERLLNTHMAPRERHSIEKRIFDENRRLKVFEAVRCWQGSNTDHQARHS